LVRGFAYQIYTSPNNGNGSERKDSCFGITSIMEFEFMTTVAQSICTHYSSLSDRPDIFLGSGNLEKKGPKYGLQKAGLQ
jgi:hypothetical protein